VEAVMAKKLTLVEELRSWIEPYKTDGLDALLGQAADEIERLTIECAVTHVGRLNEQLCKEEGCVKGLPVLVCFRCGQQYLVPCLSGSHP
jgi:hypothetical protein